ncbi:MAG: polysaccharide biosynthesis/export family protein [Planctomycetaceae bacterium]|nr:polysaccharide biosynthesis/export family protein [Planctomycetaceae bacterium]
MTTNSAHRWILAAGLLLPVVTGCAAFRPISGVPARYMPDDFRGPTRSGKQTIDLSLLRQSPPAAHLVDTGDVLSVYIEGELGKRDQPPPSFFPQNSDIPPTVGFPIPVRDDGTISLPLIGALPVRGLNIRQVEDAIRQGMTVKRQFLNPDVRIFVALQQPRSHRILVIRQEASSDVSVGAQGQLNIGALKRGTGKVVNLPVYKNDVLNALAETGGLPGLDAENAIYVIRSGRRATGVASPAPQFAPALPPTSAHRTDAVIRSQSPEGSFNPHADYRTASPAGWSQPQHANPYAQPVQYVPPPMPVPSAPPAMWPAQPPQPMLPPTPLPQQPPLPHSSMAPPPANWTSPELMSPNSQAAPPPPGWTGPPQTPTSPGDAWAPPVTPIPEPMWGGQPSMPSHTVGDWPIDLGTDLSDRRIIRIPVRLGPGEYTDIREEDIILGDGDIVFIESRETEVFYTGGLLGGGQYTLPRDYDLDVLGAIAVAQGQGSGGGGSRATQSQGGQSALNADVSISASQLIVLRPLPDGTQLTIQVDLYEAVRNRNERIIVQPGDYLILQYTRGEAVMAFIERHLLEGALFGVAAAQLNQGGN